MRLSFPDQASSPGEALPEYDAPPVIETAVGIQFDGLNGYTSLAAASFWDRIRDEYPVVEEREPVEPSFETFGTSDSRTSADRLDLEDRLVQPRFVFLSKPGTEILQLQKDRLFFNWRRTEEGEAYPRYVHVRERLSSGMDALYDWVATSAIGEVVPTQCEAVYVNRIPLADAEGNMCGLSFIFPWLKGLMGTTEDGAFRFRRRLHDDTGEPRARLNFDLRYGTDAAGGREAHLLLAVRGRPSEANKSGCLGFIDGGRDVIVRTFTEITSPEAHLIWERRR